MKTADFVPAEKKRPRVLLLTTSLLTDRMFMFTNLLDVLGHHVDVDVWSQSCGNPRHVALWSSLPVEVNEFPKVDPFPEFPYNYLRRINEFAWDYSQKPPSRISLLRHRGKRLAFELRLLKPIARFLALLKLEQRFEKRVESLLLSFDRSFDAENRLKAKRPDAVLVTGPFQFKQPAVAAVAKKLGIQTIAFIPSWDNLSTKNRMVLNYDAYFVWNEKSRNELHYFYPATKGKPVYVVGAPQFDLFFNESLFQSRQEYCLQQGLNPALPIVVYAVGSPNFLVEHHGALHLAARISNGELGDIQMLVRPHPLHNEGEMETLFERFGPRVIVQKTAQAGDRQIGRTQDRNQIIDWINTFRHANIVVNLSSTVSIDAAIFDRPVVNLDFDPQPGQSDQQLIKDINHLWTHFKPVAESGGLYLVDDFDEMVEAILTYLNRPELHSANRRWIAEYVCGFLDGKSGDRMADAIIEFVYRQGTEN